MIDRLRKTYWEQRSNLRQFYKLNRARYFGPFPAVWDSRVIFIHIPKAAGTSIARLDVGVTFGHQTYGFYEKWCPEGRTIPPSFTVVRNPFNRYVSAFRYLNEGRGNRIDNAWARRNHIFSSDLNSFALEHLEKPATQDWMHFRPQAEYTCGKGQDIAVDHVLRFETLRDDWSAFAHRYGLETTLPSENTAPSDPSAHLSDAAKAVVREVYKKDFALFDYED